MKREERSESHFLHGHEVPLRLRRNTFNSDRKLPAGRSESASHPHQRRPSSGPRTQGKIQTGPIDPVVNPAANRVTSDADHLNAALFDRVSPVDPDGLA